MAFRKGRIPDYMKPKLDIWPTDSETKPNVCFVVDECDSVLYDNAGSVIRTSGPLPFANKIKEIAAHIANEVKKTQQKRKTIY